MKRRKHPHNRIWTVLGMLAAVFLSLYSIRSTFVSVVALEQSARCGAVEHVHTAPCYEGTTPVCGKTAHTHNRNCYLVLLKDNDINILLSQVDADRDHNLEQLIYQTVDTALQYNTDLIVQTGAPSRPDPQPQQRPQLSVSTMETLLHNSQAPEADEVILQTSDVAVLNQTITEQAIQPAIVLNEDLYTTGVTGSVPTDTTLLTGVSGSVTAPAPLDIGAGNGGVSTLALGDTTPTRFSTNYMYFYIQLDGKWSYLTNLQRTGRDSSGSIMSRSYTPYITTNTLLSKLNTELESDGGVSPGFTADNLALEFSNSSNVTSTTWSGEYAQTTGSGNSRKTTFGTYSGTGASNNANAAKHVRLYHQSGTTRRPVAYFTVTLTYPNGTSAKQYVAEGDSFKLPAGYTWQEGSTDFNGGTSVTVNSTRAFSAVIDPGDVTGKLIFYVQLDGEWTRLTAMDRTGITYSGNTGTPYSPYITTATMLSGVNDQLRQSTVDSDANFTASNLTGRYADSATSGTWNWSSTSGNNTLYGSYADWNDADAAKHIRLYRNTTTPLAYYSVTLNYRNGTSSRVYVAAGESFTLPSGQLWVEGTTEYNGGTSITVNAPRTFNASGAAIRVEYTLNFPTSFPTFGNNNRVNTPKTPTIGDTTSTTTATDRVEEGDSTTVWTVSETTVTATTNHAYGQTYPIRFMGWRTETGQLISPSTNLTWEALQAYANGDSTAKLTGVWEYGINNMVNFYVLYNAKVNETTNASDLYTPSIYSTYVGGTINTGLSIDARTDEAAYENDITIRGMYGPSSGSMWLDTFPTDEYVFEQLKQYAQGKLLTVDGITVNPNDLNASAYAIRWYMLKHHSDGWHIDGKLTRKKGQITVDKEFFGATDVIHEAEQGFHMVAINGTLDTKGNFIPYTPANSLYHQYVLVLREYDKNALRSNYPNATFLVYDHTADYADGEGFEWLIEGVDLDEYWQITEHPMSVDGQMYYAEYSVYDTDGETSAVAEYGTTASVVGKTFALDEDPDQGLLVDFRNYYYPTESILIKKEDADTGQPIGGAAFELWQEHDGVSTQLKFSYDEESKRYTYDNNGNITRISTGDEGFTTVTTTGFSYSHGPVTVKEVIAPTGYASAPHMTLTEQSNKVSITDMRDGNGNAVPQSQWADYGEVYDDGSVLIVKDRVASLTQVTANKVWADSARADSVTLVLQANGTTATNLFPGLPNVRAELNAANNWQYTWTGLPTYANGAPVSWSVKEIMVGSETTLADGTSFANWTVIYANPVRTDRDSDGVTDHWQCTVTNSVRRAQLYLVKTDPGGRLLPGAAFELVEVSGSGNPVSGAVTYTGVTDENGLLRFDNLKYTTRYRLTETRPPTGYKEMSAPAYLRLAADGTVTVETHSNVSGTGLYRVNVVNIAPLPLPTTGGSGPGVFFGLGGALMLFSVCGYMLLHSEKKGRYKSS